MPIEEQFVLIIMQNRNKFRKSDLAIQELECIINCSSKSRLRSSYSTKTSSTLDVPKYRATISNHHIPQNPFIFRKQQAKSKANLRDKLSFLQEKLNNAKMEMNKTRHTGQKIQIKQNDTHFLKIKPSYTETSQMRPKMPEQMKKSQIQQFISSQPKPSNITTFSINPYDSIKNNNYYLAEVVRARHEKNSLAVQHITTSIFILQKCKKSKKYIQQQQHQPIILPELAKPHLKTLYLDLDETLIHCFDNAECQPDFRLNISIQGTPVNVDITIRPYALTFLKKISKKWQVVIFTASHKDYADAILNQLDPEGTLFHHRLYRQHCTLFDQIYIKDISRINRDLSKVVLVDNAAYSYCMQLSNGIPILPYYDGKDFELSALEGYLARLQKCEDVRVMNRNYFKLQQYGKYDCSSDLIEEIYLNSQKSNFP